MHHRGAHDGSRVNDTSLIGVGAGAIDELTGKAIYGTPGPGTYKAPSLWNYDPAVPAEARAGRHVFDQGPRFTAQGRTRLASREQDASPGPVKFRPVYSWVEPNVKQAPFGKSSRDAEAWRFISRTLDQGAGTVSPGPGTYRVKTGKGHSGTIGDGASVKFGTSLRPQINAGLGEISPGARYTLPSVRDSPAYSFAPLNSGGEGRLRDRAAEAAFARKQYQGASMNAIAGPGDTPAPGAYHTAAALTANAAHANAPAVHIPEASRAEREKLCAGGGDFDVAKLGTESPNKFYDAKSTLQTRGGGMPRSKRFHSPEKGLSCAGPLISKGHLLDTLGYDSPGPVYENKFDASVDLPAKFSFPKAKRSELASKDAIESPAPNTYLIKKDAAHYKYGVSQAYGMAPNLRTDWAKFSGTAGMPGPGAYNVDKPGINMNRAPTYKLGEVVGKHGRSSSLLPAGCDLVPGPGAYIDIHKSYSDREKAPGFSFGCRDGTDKHGKPSVTRTGAHTGVSRYFSASQSQAQTGADSPGVGAQNLREMTGRGETRILRAYSGKFVRASRDTERKQFISKLHTTGSLGLDAPGPGLYDVSTSLEVSSKFARNAGAVWGKAKRPQPGTVRF